MRSLARRLVVPTLLASLIAASVPAAAWGAASETDPPSTSLPNAPAVSSAIDIGEPLANPQQRGAAQDAATVVLTFSEVSLGTYVTDQFEPLGIRFGGDAPFTTNDGASNSSPVLSGSPMFNGSISATFVTKTGEPRPVDGFSVKIGYVDTLNSVAVDIEYVDEPTETVLVDAGGFVVLAVGRETPTISSFRVYAVGDEPAGFAIDDVTFTGLVSTSGSYVALGDSFQSGEGAWNYESGTDVDGVNECHRSLNAYPHLLVDRGVVDFDLDFRACSGALIVNIYAGDPSSDGPPWNEPDSQLGALDSNTRLVTIGIGGNDLDFAGIVKDCVLNSLSRRPCESDYDDEVDAKLESLQSGEIREELLRLYERVREQAPNARILVISYPMFFSKSKDAFGGFYPCALVQWMDGQWMNAAVKTADNTLGNIARSAGFEYVNMDDVLLGHEQCTSEPGINPIVGLADSESFHPNALGHELMADRIQDVIQVTPNPTFVITRGQTVTRLVQVTGRSFWVNVGWPGSDVETTLISPSGIRYDRVSPRESMHANGPTYESFGIENPEPGEWTIEMYGADIADEGEAVTLTTFDEPVPNTAPVAAIAVTGGGNEYTFDASGSTDADGQIVSYEWDFGDGTYATGAQVTHVFPAGEEYYVMVQATDEAGDSGYATVTEPIVTPPGEQNRTDHFVGGPLTLTNTMTMAGGVTVDGSFTCNSNGTIEGDLIASGSVTLTNNCHITGDVYAGGSVDITATPVIDGAVRAVGGLVFQSGARIAGPVTLGGAFSSRDGATIATLQELGALGGIVTQYADGPAPVVQAPASPDVDLASAISWRSWMNATAEANGAPSWSQGLSANPGCVMAPWASSVNGSSILVGADLVVDATRASSSCGTVALQQMQITLSADLTIVASSLNAINGLRVTSADGGAHSLTIVVPGEIGASGSVNLSSNTLIADPIIASIWAPGAVSVGGNSTVNATVISKSITGWGDVTIGRQ